MFGDFQIIKKCSVTKARVSEFELANTTARLPIFMPVATYGAMRCVKPSLLHEQIILCNTYHLRNLNRNIKELMGWKRAVLTDSGGFQIQSLPDVAVDDEGIRFANNLFTPENSMKAQMALGADIIMQLDDVVNPMMPRELHVTAVRRSLEWLERAVRYITDAASKETSLDEGDKESGAGGSAEEDTQCCMVAEAVYADKTQQKHGCYKDAKGGREPAKAEKLKETLSAAACTKSDTAENETETRKRAKTQRTTGAKTEQAEQLFIRPRNGQVIFPIIQGGLEQDLRKISIEGILKFKPLGLAIGGLSGGEDKNDFCRIVHYCCSELPENMPRYVMGIGYPEDLVVCYALGTDMTDCVYPTRTGRFGRGFSDTGDVMIDNRVAYETGPIDPECECDTCRNYTRAYLSLIRGTVVYCTLMSVHNLFYMRRLTQRVRESIIADDFPNFLRAYLRKRFAGGVPDWVVNALKRVSVEI